MGKSIFKYVGPSSIMKVFSIDGFATVKCSYPKDFNDPYELFLSLNFDEQPEYLAFYTDTVGNLDQVPTTCFSLSPSVIPMWAHYAGNHEGFVIEFDEEQLSRVFAESGFGDVDYRDQADESLSEMLYRAAVTGKPRHTYMLRSAVFSAAYYTKTTCWEYEQERRMVVDIDETRRVGDIILLDIPASCIRRIIAGTRASVDTTRILIEKVKNLNCEYLQLKIGRSSSEPFFVDQYDKNYLFSGTQITRSENNCNSCSEPVAVNRSECSWCRIDDAHREEAARTNPYRLYHHYGLLDSYIEQMNKISRGMRRK